jgi:hypothetical protein
MLADYFLTLVGAKQRDKKYSEHFTTEHYELNPMWQKQIAQRKWFSPKHLLLTIIVTLLLVLVMEPGGAPEPLAQGILGGLLVFFGAVIGRHLYNLLIFRDINRKPNEISGQVTMAHGLVLRMSLYQSVVVLVPLALIAALSPTPFVLGGLLGVVVLLVHHLRWIGKYRKEKRSLNGPDTGG